MAVVKKSNGIGLIFLIFMAIVLIHSVYTYGLSGNQYGSCNVYTRIRPTDLSVYENGHVYTNFTYLNRKIFFFTVEDTHSMQPTFGINHYVVAFIPQFIDDIHVCDIIGYTRSDTTKIIHRVVSIESNINGKYFITKGDNNKEVDSVRVAYSQIDAVVLEVIY